MATYILLTSLTDEGRRTLKERPERLQEVNREIESMGARVVRQVALLGAYDFVNVIEAPDNETITAVATELGTRGTIRIQTLAAMQAANGAAPAPPERRTSTFVVFTRLTPEGRLSLQRDEGRLDAIAELVRGAGATIVQQYRVLGEYDFVTFAEAPDNGTAARIAADVSSLGTVRLHVYPAIALERFLQLLTIRSYRTEPHAWQTQLWARILRRLGRYWVTTRHVQRFCRPLSIEGREILRGVRGPAIIIANHTSHFDTPVALSALPEHLRARTAVAAAADRFYRSSKRTWWFSLFWNTFPIARGGGSKAISYPMSLLENGWSILIYPEGGRSRPGKLERFHHGVTLMAMAAKVPVVPVFLEGLQKVMPKGDRNAHPGPVSARLGPPISLEGVTDGPAGTARLEAGMRELAGLRPRIETPAASPAPERTT